MGEVMEAATEADQVLGGGRTGDEEADHAFVSKWLTDRGFDPEDVAHAAMHDGVLCAKQYGGNPVTLMTAVMAGFVTGVIAMERRTR